MHTIKESLHALLTWWHYTGTLAPGNMTSSSRRVYTTVQAVGHHFINPLPNLTQAVAGQLSTRVFLEPLNKRFRSSFSLFFLVILCSYVCISANKIDTFFSPIQMEWEPKSHVQLVVGTWVMYLKARGSQHLQMNVIVSIVFHSSSLLLLRAVLAVSCEV